MTTREPRPFDFREVAALDDTAVHLRDWVAKSSSFFSDFWDEVTGFSAQLSLGQVNTESYGKALEDVSKESHYTIAELEGHMSFLFYASASELQTIVSELFSLDQLEEPKELSPIEISASEMFIRELGNALTAGWMGREEISIATGSIGKDPRKTRLYRAKDLMTKTSIEIGLKESKSQIHVFLPKQETSGLLEHLIDSRENGEPTKPSQELLASLPVDLTVVIGNAKIPMLVLSSLKPGQLIKLDQRIDQPITGYVDDSPFYKCWPGRSGDTQSIEISECLLDQANGAKR